MIQLDEAMTRLERRAAMCARVDTVDDGATEWDGCLASQAEVITVLVDVDRDVAIAHHAKLIDPPPPTMSVGDRATDDELNPEPDEAAAAEAADTTDLHPDHDDAIVDNLASPPDVDSEQQINAVNDNAEGQVDDNAEGQKDAAHDDDGASVSAVADTTPQQDASSQTEINIDDDLTKPDADHPLTNVACDEDPASTDSSSDGISQMLTSEPSDLRATAGSTDVDGGYREACRNTLAALKGTHCPVLLLVSEDDQGGTARIVENMLVALAELSDDPVLAIDACDGRLGRLFNIQNEELDCQLSATSWQDAIVQTTSPGLCLLSIGPNGVTDGKLDARIDEMKSRFGLIAIDGGALNQDHYKQLTASATGSLFLVRLQLTTETWAKQARDKVIACGGSPLGCVVTVPQNAAA